MSRKNSSDDAGKKKEKKAKLVQFRENKKGYHISHLMNFLRVFAYPIHALIYPFRLHGRKKVGKGACIYVGNHYCIWDVFYPAHTTWEGVHFLAKMSILEAPILGPVAKRVGVIGAMRDGTDVRTLMDSMRVLKNGEKISMFPEGTRNMKSDEEFLPFRGGAALMAIKTKTPIVPFVICNRPHVFHMTHVMFGEAIELSEFYDRKLTPEDYEAADQLLVNRLYELREEYRSMVAAKKRR